MQQHLRKAALALFTYNRASHTGAILKNLNELAGAEHTDLFIFSDGPKTEKSREEVERVRSLIRDFERENRFSHVYAAFSDHNKGLAVSVIEGVSDIIARYGSVIVVEDDLVLSGDFLSYMNDGLDFYRDDPSVWAISGYSFPMKALEDYPHDVFATGRGSSWGWATWQDRWVTVDWDVKTYRDFRFNFARRRAFGRWGKDLPYMLDAYMYGEAKSWAIRWCYAAFLQGKKTIYPKFSRVVNQGTDGSGTNYTRENKNFDTVLYHGNKKCTFENVAFDERIRKAFAGKYLSGWMHAKVALRWFLIKTGVLHTANRGKNS